MKAKILKKKKLKISKETTLISKDEMNLAEFPFTVLSHKTAKSKKTIEWIALVPGRNGKLINQEWTVTGSDKYGLPHAIDNDFYLGIMLFLKRNNFESRTIYFTECEFLRTIGKGISQGDYKRLEQSLDRMKGVMIKATNTFWDNKEKCYLKSVGAFGIIDEYNLYTKEKEKNIIEDSKMPYSKIIIGETLFQSIKSSYIKSLDLKFYFSLKTPLAKRLFRYLDKNRYKKEVYEIELLKLASLLPLEEKRTWDIKRWLEKPHKELIDKSFLEKVNYGKTQTGKHKVIYTFAQIKSLEPEQTEILLEIPESSISQKIRALTERGITEITAHELVEKYPDRIMKQVDVFDYLTEKKDPKVSKNPAGFLCKSIEKDFAAPKSYISKEQRQKIKEHQIRETQEWIKQEAEKKVLIETETIWNNKVDKFIATLPPDEQKALRQQAEQEIRKKAGFCPSVFVDRKLRELVVKEYCLVANKI